jgi:cell filamentation protein
MQQDPEVAEFISRPPDPARPYVYPGTNIRINKFGILNPYAIDQVARATSTLRAELLRLGPLAGDFDLPHLQAIHRFLFQDIYPWAGEIRVVDFDRSEDPYSHPDSIVGACTQLFARLHCERLLRDLAYDQFIQRLAYYLQRLYTIHPFRDGNGRTLRAFFEQLAAERGYRFDLASAPQEERHATAQAAHRGNMSPLIDLIRRVTTPRNAPANRT